MTNSKKAIPAAGVGYRKPTVRQTVTKEWRDAWDAVGPHPDRPEAPVTEGVPPGSGKANATDAG